MANLTDAEIAEILRDLKVKPTVPIHPHVSWALDCSRNKSYAMARQGGEMFLRVDAGGKRPMFRGISAVIRRRLGIEAGGE
jgi:hypothetical protein